MPTRNDAWTLVASGRSRRFEENLRSEGYAESALGGVGAVRFAGSLSRPLRDLWRFFFAFPGLRPSSLREPGFKARPTIPGRPIWDFRAN